MAGYTLTGLGAGGANGESIRYEQYTSLTGVVSGTVVIWTGTVANIPSGYVVCDGNNSTQNLLNKYVKNQTNASTEAGSTGGALTHNHRLPSTGSKVIQGGSNYEDDTDTKNHEPPFGMIILLMKT
jgi:hypothetical protein